MKLARSGGRFLVISDRGAHDITSAVDTVLGPTAPARGWWPAFCSAITGGDIGPHLTEGAPLVDIDPTALDAPVGTPGKVVGCLGNDRDRATGDDAEPFDLFLKAPSAIVGPNDQILLPAETGRGVVPECELAVAIGSTTRSVSAEAALRHVAGYLIGLDITLRGDGDRSRRKSFDTFCPLGPWLVTSDELPRPEDLAVEMTVDGEVHQAWSTASLRHHVGETIAIVSASMRLDPGDIILTGAPKVDRKLRSGDVVVARIERIGAMSLAVI